MKYIRDIENLEGVKVILRLDLNVPVKNGVVVDDYRIRMAMPTIKYLRDKKARIIIVSHIENADAPTLIPVAKYLDKNGVICEFIKDYKKVATSESSIILLENLREHVGEKENDRKFAKELASLGDIYINEAFAVSHRAHASISKITEYLPSYAGFLFEQEIKHLSTAFRPDHPFLFILGGAKFETKLPLIEKFMNIADKVFVGGALANNFFKEQGRPIGRSMVSPQDFKLSRFLDNPKLMLPIDEVKSNNAILDAGPKTLEVLGEEIVKAKYILWNGPLGAYEMGYTQPTLKLAEMIAHATMRGAKSILGGGDTLAAIAELKNEDKYTFVSTGGGAMLEFLAKGTLPAIEALNSSHH